MPSDVDDEELTPKQLAQRYRDAAALLQVALPKTSVDATDEECQQILEDWKNEDLPRAWKTAAKLYHPDKGGDPVKFLAAKEAFERLQHLQVRRRPEPASYWHRTPSPPPPPPTATHWRPRAHTDAAGNVHVDLGVASVRLAPEEVEALQSGLQQVQEAATEALLQSFHEQVETQKRRFTQELKDLFDFQELFGGKKPRRRKKAAPKRTTII